MPGCSRCALAQGMQGTLAATLGTATRAWTDNLATVSSHPHRSVCFQRLALQTGVARERDEAFQFE